MTKKTGLLAALLFGVFLSVPAQAAYVTGNDLLQKCESPKQADVYSCMSYVAAVIDYQVMMQSLGTAPSADFCLPENYPLDKAAVSVLRYLKRNPQMGTFIAAPTVTMALQHSHPCGPPKTRKKKKKNG